MPIRRSLRFKFAATFTIAGLVLVLSYAIAAIQINRQQEDARIDQIVSDEMDDLLQSYQRQGGVIDPPVAQLPPDDVHPDTRALSLRKRFRASWLVRGYVAPVPDERVKLPGDLRALEPGFHNVDSGEAHYRVEVREIGKARFYLAYLVTQHLEREHKFTRALIFSAGLTLLFTAVVGMWLSGRLTRQIDDLARRVRQLDGRVVEDTLEHYYQEREVAALASAFDGYHQRTVRLLERERTFTADISHELRTPLTTIQTSSELLLNEPGLSAKGREQVERIARGATRLSGLVNAFLLLAREQASGKRDVIDLQECAEQVVELVRDRAQTKGLTLDVDIPPGLFVNAPSSALQVVLSNLLDNAVRYTESGGIRVSAKANMIEIADTGCGFEMSRIPDLFRRFRRGKAARNSSEGFGLGLSIVKRICEQIGWRISIKSPPEGGTRVRLMLAA